MSHSSNGGVFVGLATAAALVGAGVYAYKVYDPEGSRDTWTRCRTIPPPGRAAAGGGSGAEAEAAEAEAAEEEPPTEEDPLPAEEEEDGPAAPRRGDRGSHKRPV
ncbi:hypothetical protein Rsub_00593 [Raphidocelis subcapitata]|uniref:Uncharacterized protein n=1 Tax=Raphidocelis subcapitata TaxID=307507 RepID=A0A2V0NKM2_9CHLO|nr:hypothetical protein Rsub_00593 [Raphidocelis subcapitata]|eukprot:GBF87881.1 hypothetical protein Rsub_00593 [Raphidocelis subcapitata]